MSFQNDFTLKSGDSKVIRVVLKDSDKVAVDLTGSSITWHAAKYVTSESLIEKDVDDGITVVDAEGGIFEILVEPADTATLG